MPTDTLATLKRTLRQREAELKIGLAHYVLGARPLVALTAPLIYLMAVPFALLDLSVCLYQAACFPVYGIKKVRRADYIVFDRSSLRYLNLLERLNCVYCSYGNGVIAYVREVAARTEQYWCPIKHAQQILSVHGHYKDFVEFGDAEAYRQSLENLRARLGDVEVPSSCPETSAGVVPIDPEPQSSKP